MVIKPFSNLLRVGCFAVLVLPMSGCGRGKTPQGPELGELESYLNEHPELMETADEEMDEIEGNEFANAGAS